MYMSLQPSSFDNPFILNLISERQIFFVVDGILKGPFHSHKGTPQGSTLSPILFDIYLKDIEKHLHRDTRILLYADDIVIYSTSRSPIVAHNSIQISLDRINFFLRNKGLDLSPEKSQWLLFSRRRSHLVLPPLMIFRAELPMVSVVRFLGIFLDSKLSGKTDPFPTFNSQGFCTCGYLGFTCWNLVGLSSSSFTYFISLCVQRGYRIRLPDFQIT